MTGTFKQRLRRFFGKNDATEARVLLSNHKTAKGTQQQFRTDRQSKKSKHFTMTAPYPTHLAWRFLEWLFLSFDVFYISDFFVWISRFIKPNTRPLSSEERQLAESIYGNSIDYSGILLDERAYIGPMTMRFAYVGLGVIHSWGRLRKSTFIHELIHVWQYQQVGAVYIPRALYAQHTPLGYNYGGVEALEVALAEGKHFLDFNYEQQGEILADYYCLLYGEVPTFCRLEKSYIPTFEAILATVGIGWAQA